VAIKVHYQNVKFHVQESTEVKKWLESVIKSEGKDVGNRTEVIVLK